jgi:hypothetical protein
MENQEDKQIEAENKFKQVFSSLRLPAPPAPPPSLMGASDEVKQLWTLDQRLTALEARYNLVVKIAWRTSAAVVALVGSLVGWDWVGRFLSLLGVN